MPNLIKERRSDTLTTRDHQILINLIRGKSSYEVCAELNLSHASLGTQIARMKKFVGARSTYELIALEVINLMEETDDKKVCQLLQTGQ
jgi:DNA-binding NarL/FixJ family response regulator